MAKKPSTAVAPPKPDTSGWEAERKNVESAQQDLEAKKAANIEKIGRLETAKKDFKEILSDVRKLQGEVSFKDIIGAAVSDFWQGNEYNSYDMFMHEEFIPNYKNYSDGLKDYRNNIKEKINQLKNENSQYDSTLSSLSNQWDSLTSQINAALS